MILDGIMKFGQSNKNSDGDVKVVQESLENERINKSNFVLTYDEIFVSPWAANISYEMDHREIIQVIFRVMTMDKCALKT